MFDILFICCQFRAPPIIRAFSSHAEITGLTFLFGTVEVANLIDEDHSTCLTLPRVTGSDGIPGYPVIFTVGVSRGFTGEVLVFLNSNKHNVQHNVDVIVSVATIDLPQSKFVECSIFSATNGVESSSCVFLCDMQTISSNQLHSINFFLLDQMSSNAESIDVCDLNVVYLL